MHVLRLISFNLGFPKNSIFEFSVVMLHVFVGLSIETEKSQLCETVPRGSAANQLWAVVSQAKISRLKPASMGSLAPVSTTRGSAGSAARKLNSRVSHNDGCYFRTSTGTPQI